MLAPSTIDRTDWHPTLVLLFLLVSDPSPISNGNGNLPNIGLSMVKEKYKIARDSALVSTLEIELLVIGLDFVNH